MDSKHEGRVSKTKNYKTRDLVKWRVKHVPAKTVYMIQCHDIVTLTYPFGAPIHPKDADFVAEAVREDIPEHWALWAYHGNMSWVQSTHDTKEAARAALRANRLAPPNPPDLSQPLRGDAHGREVRAPPAT